MSSVEDKIVAMKFDNKQFEPAAKTTMSTLDRLKAALNFSGSNKGLNDLQNSANRFSLAGLANGASGVSAKFLAMSAVAVTAIANIVNRAVDAGVRVAKAFTIDPVKAGFSEYELKLGSVQTILANTAAAGTKLKDVNKTLQDLNHYADQTIYNFGQMAKNIGTFTAAGVDLKTATSSIKGIANLAALSGSNSEQASTAMYQLSQAISSGKVSLQDWNSVVNAGMGGTVFQRALAQTAEKMGTLGKGSVELKGKMKNVSIEGKSFRESITAKPGEKSWLTDKVLTATLSQFTGDMSDAELATAGFTKAQIKSIQAQAKTAKEAATQVKTFTQLTGTLKEAAGSGWAQTFEILLGDFTEAKKLWTDVSNVLGGFINKSANARNKMLEDWKDLGGRSMALKGLRNIFAAIVQVITPIKEAFREIFPATTGKQLFALTKMFLEFTKTLKIGAGTADKIKRTFAGVFAVFSIGWSVVKALLGVIGNLFGLIGKNSGSFLEVTANVGDFLVKLDKTIKKGDLVNKFFKKLGQILAVPLQILREFGGVIKGLFTGFDVGISEAIGNAFGRIGKRLKPLAGLGRLVAAVWDRLGPIFRKVGEFLKPLGTAIGHALQGVGTAIGKAFRAGDFSSVFDGLNTVLLTGIVLLITKFFRKGIKLDFGGGLLTSITSTFTALTDTLKVMQDSVKAKTIMTIAIAIALITVSIVALSLIDSDKLTKSLAAIGVAFGYLLGAMAILTKISGSAGFAKIPIIAASMILLSIAILILTFAVRSLSNLSWEELSKGLVGVAALLLMIVGVSKGLEKSSGSMIRAGLAMIPLAIGLKILASAVKDFADMNWADMSKGLTGVAASLLIVAGAMRLMPKSMIAQSVGLLIVATALKILASAFKDMGGMSWKEIAKGMVVLAGSLLILAGGLYLMTGTIAGAAALVVAALAFAILVPVLKAFGDMKWESIGKVMTVLAGSLLILAGGLYLMTGTIGGAVALGFATTALAALVPVLILLGTMSWESIGKGLAALAGVFLVLGVAGLVLTPVVPMILALAVAVILLGAGLALIGIGFLAVATAFSIFAAAGAAGLVVLSGMIALIPLFMAQLAKGIGTFVVTLAEQGGKITRAFASLLVSMLNAIILVAPKIGKAMNVLIDTALKVLDKNLPKLIAMGIKIIVSLLLAINSKINLITAIAVSIIVKFLNAISRNMDRISTAGANLIVKFIQGIQKNRSKITDAAVKMIIAFVNSTATSIRAHQSEMQKAGLSLAGAIISGMTGGLSDLAWKVAGAAARMAKGAWDAAKAALSSHSPSKKFMELGNDSSIGMAIGIAQKASAAETAAVNMTTSVLDTVKSTLTSMSDMMSGDINLDPVIRPILDLSSVSKDASKIGGMLDQKQLSADLSFRQAMGISNDQLDNADNAANAEESTGNVKFEYNQTVTSPKALDHQEIFRNTRNLISMSKAELRKK